MPNILIYVLLGVVVLMAIMSILAYNRLVALRNRVQNAWAQIDVQLKRRTDLIPNLVETVKGYAAHEKEVLARVTEARSALMRAKTPAEAAEADNMLTGTLKTLFAVSEAYPELKANQNFMMLQEELAGTENKIAYARQAYNDSVLQYHNALQSFPSNLLAGLFGFKPTEYFNVTDEASRVPVQVRF